MEITLTIQNKSGLHARPAALFSQKASSFKSNIVVVKDGKTSNGKSILAVMALGVKQGESIALTIDGPDASEAAAALKKLVAENFGE